MVHVLDSSAYIHHSLLRCHHNGALGCPRGCGYMASWSGYEIVLLDLDNETRREMRQNLFFFFGNCHYL